jgi:hypothetical protein
VHLPNLVDRIIGEGSSDLEQIVKEGKQADLQRQRLANGPDDPIRPSCDKTDFESGRRCRSICQGTQTRSRGRFGSGYPTTSSSDHRCCYRGDYRKDVLFSRSGRRPGTSGTFLPRH